MIVRSDITELWDFKDNDAAVSVVKHNYKTSRSVKYLGYPNQDYPRKNWSSVMLWNCGHADNRQLTPVSIQTFTGEYLHRFCWLNDDQIGTLPTEWNWLPDEYGVNDQAKLLHYTLGTPCFHDFADTPQATAWHREKMLTEFCQQIL